MHKRVAVLVACDNSAKAGLLTWLCVLVFGERWTLDVDDDRIRLAKWRGRFYHLSHMECGAC